MQDSPPLNLVNPQTSEEKRERLVRDLYTVAGSRKPNEAHEAIREILARYESNMKKDPIDQDPLRVLRDVLRTCPRPGTLDDLREAIDAALLHAESPPIKDTGAWGQIEAFRADLARIAAERDKAREEAMARLADAEQMEAQRDTARSALAEAQAEVERHRLNTESEAREVESLYRERTKLQAEIREINAEWESAIERAKSAEHLRQEAQAEVERLTRALQSQAEGALKTIDAAHAAGRREGIGAAANRIIQSCCCGVSDRCNWCDDEKLIRSLLSEPEPEVSQDAAPATASDPTAIKSSAEGREVSMEDATSEAGGDSLVARLRRIVAWFAIPEHRGTPCEEDLADITAAADALEGAESEVARRIAEAVAAERETCAVEAEFEAIKKKAEDA